MSKKIAIILLVCTAGSLSSQVADNSTLAIMDVVPTNIAGVKSQLTYEYMIDIVNDLGIYRILERSALQNALDEMSLSLTGLVDDSTAAEIGQLAGAEYIIVSNLIGDGGATYLSARIVTVETGQVLNTAIVRQEGDDNLEGLTKQVMAQLLAFSDSTEPSEDQTIPTYAQDGYPPLFISTGLMGLIPVSDDSQIFTLGFGATFELDWRILSAGPGNLFVGAGTGVLVDFATEEKGVAYPYTLMSVPLFLAIGYEYPFGDFYVNVRLSGGYSLNLFIYQDVSPFGVNPETAFNPMINPGLSFGYRLNDRIGISVFGNWTTIFFKSLPYTAIGIGVAVDINL